MSIQNNFGISERSYKIIIETLSRFPEIEQALIFGSRALGNAKPGSDIDIALFGDKLNDDILLKINSILNEKENIPYFIDILNFNNIENLELKKHIIDYGKRII